MDFVPNIKPLKKTQLILSAQQINQKLDILRSHSDQYQCEGKEFQTSDGFSLYYRIWKKYSALPPNRLVLCLHGLHSHGEKFVLLADHLAEFNWEIISLDLRGHGLSWEKLDQRGDIKEFELWIRDLEEFIAFLKRKYVGLALHIVAESMGGAIAITYTAKNPKNIQSLVLLAPAVKPWPVTEFAMIQAALTRAILKGVEKQSIHNASKGRFSTKAKAYIEYQQNDPFRLVDVSPRYYYQAVKMVHNLKNLNFDNFCPTFVFFGENDHIIDFQGIKEFISLIQTKNKLLAYIPKAYHELLTDKEALSYGIYDKIILWIKYYGKNNIILEKK
ncbi:2-succinyl-6-hydroxy-2,4-cyclohexadiene-1-carboxylate synthase [Candidatus Lokiarchaeum ossiferum]|uniref:2-succinyl-6-hydroxy-2, 4-cyclohexadiene-1-carboxylate synthase n=1 Tax=Candidatus Lokiarchaeum ossiferum TaxID=2951803 RepID=A0ABY6HU06_9ARCH|nr:2-succinyl-6-hydroxy-2,4-cyclohexadiene-1-carboxylate synthase [Candidatus Lokiarchaeum sp. B-35]